MAYPWPGFSTFRFLRVDGEVPLQDTDTGWNLIPSIANTRLLGSSVNSVQVLTFGSQERSFEMLLSPSRHDALKAMIGQSGEFTDWLRPVPDNRQAVLAGVSQQGDLVLTRCSDGTTQFRRRTKVNLISQ